MQIFNLNIDEFVLKINDYVTYIVTFLKYIFNSIIAIKNVGFHWGNWTNSFSIIWNFALSIFYILIFITFLVFFDSIFSIVKQMIKITIYLPIKLLILPIYCFLLLLKKYLFTPKSELKQSVQTNNFNLDELK